MFILLGELSLWSFDDDINIKDTDFGAFRYHDKRIDNVHDEGKRSYRQKRGMVCIPQNKKGNKLKDAIKYLEDQLKDYSVIYCQWYDHCTITLMLNSGLLIYMQVCLSTGDVEKIIFDKYLIGKVSDRISDVVISKNHLVCTYNDSQVTLVHFTKQKRHIFEKIARLEPKVSVLEICGPSGRRLDKKIQLNRTGDLILIWWKSTMNEVYPWSPTVKEHDRANVHLYRLIGIKLELLCYLRTEFDPLCIMFNARHDNVIHSVEQKVSRKGEVTIEWRTYEVSQQDKLQRIAVVSVPLPTHTSCVRFSPNQEMLLLCCIDGSMILHDQAKGTGNSVKAAFIPTLASWHSDGTIFSVGNERGQFQHFDIALSCVKSQMLSEDLLPTNIMDLSSYFRSPPALLKMEWNKKCEPSFCTEYYNYEDSLFLLLFERGPFCVIKIIEGNNFSGDVLVQKYLALAEVERAVAVLLFMNWDTHPQICMHSLNKILNYLFKLPLTSERETLIQNALGSFHVPVVPISQAVEDEYGDEVRDLTRRFFHHLMRYRLFEKAFRLAIDLNDHDLFMDIHFYALALNDMEMATAAKEKAEQVLSRSSSCSSSHSTCSRPSCSLCSDSASDKDESYTEESESDDSPRKDKSTYITNSKTNCAKNPNSQAPPLPVLHPPLYSSNNLMTTSFNESFDKTENNLMSTSFNIPNSQQSIQHSFLTNAFPLESTTFNKTNNSYKPFSFSQSMNNVNETLIPTFTSMNFGKRNHLESSLGKSTAFLPTQPTVIESPLGTSRHFKSSFPDNSFLSTQFTSPTFPSTTIAITPDSSTNGDLNIMSTSFNSSSINVNSSTYTCSTKSSMSTPTSVSVCESIGRMAKSIYNNTDSVTLYSSSNNFMSTSFNDLDDDIANSQTKQNLPGLDIVPPPVMSSSLANYIHNLPKKNFALSRSTPGLTEIDESLLKHPRIRSLNTASQILQRQNSVSNILQNHHKNNFHSTRTYRVNYDLDYIPFHGSCDTLNIPTSTVEIAKQSNCNIPSKLYDSKHVRTSLSHSNVNLYINKDTRISSNIPPLPVINVSSTKISSQTPTLVDAPSTSSEKPKVKFSDTVTHILVPGVGQTHRPIQKRLVQLHPMDPKRELAESLPLCLGNDDYLKDFQPLSKNDENKKTKEPLKAEESAKIKVVHFGLL